MTSTLEQPETLPHTEFGRALRATYEQLRRQNVDPPADSPAETLMLSADGVFATIQGEGPAMGRPATFVRLAACNLMCGINGGWHCDSAYTWDWHGRLGTTYSPAKEVIRTPVAAVVERVLATAPWLVVVTGGEPLLQDRALASLLEPLHARGIQIHMETNGTRWPWASQPFVDQFVVSPKLRSSGNHALARKIDPKWFMCLRAVFKFVIADPDEDIPEIVGMLGPYGPRAGVWLMPEGTTPEAIIEGQKRLVPYCMQYGFYLGSRQHILWFGDQRGT